MFPRQTELYTYIDTVSEARELAAKVRRLPWANYDSETAGAKDEQAFDPHRANIRLMQFGIPENGVIRSYIVDCKHVPPAVFKEAFESGETVFIGHNLKFDLKHLLAYGIKVKRVWDTMVGAKTIEAGHQRLVGKHNIRDVAARTIGVDIDKGEQSSDWGGDLTESQILYAAYDVQYLASIAGVLRQMAEKLGMLKVVDLEMRVVPAVAWMEYRGIHLDTGYTQKMSVTYAELLEKREAAVRDIMGTKTVQRKRKLTIEERDKIAQARGVKRTMIPVYINVDVQEDYNYNSGPQLIQWLKDNRIAVPTKEEKDKYGQYVTKETVEADALKQMNHPWAHALLDYRETHDLLNKYILKLPKFIHPRTNNVHTEFDQNKVSGRFGAKEPPLQQIPRASDLRAMFIADPGQVLIISDFSQIELILIAMCSMDPVMGGIFKNGGDLHAHAAAQLFGMTYLEKKDPRRAAWEAGENFPGITPWKTFKPARSIAKNFNFGSWYGAWVNTLMRIVRKGGGTLTAAQTEAFLRTMQRNHPAIVQHFQGTTEFAIRNGYGLTILGRRRWYEKPRTKSQAKAISLEANNTEIQGSGADVNKAAMAEAYEAGLDIRLTVHDELVANSKPDQAEQNAWLLEQAMLRGAQWVIDNAVLPIDREVPIAVETHIGPSWAEK